MSDVATPPHSLGFEVMPGEMLLLLLMLMLSLSLILLPLLAQHHLEGTPIHSIIRHALEMVLRQQQQQSATAATCFFAANKKKT